MRQLCLSAREPEASPSTARYDRTTKLSAYERARVPEVCQPVVLELRGRTAISAVFGVSIDWDRLPAT